MNVRTLSGKLKERYRRGGLAEVKRLAAVNLVHAAFVAADRLFDARYGTDTSRPIHKPDLSIESGNVEHGTSYFPTPWWTFRKILRSLEIDPRQYTFIDFGSGKGRLPLLAKEFPRAIGVEYARELHEIAVRNARALSRAGKVEFVCGDAARFEIPSGPCVLYFFNPFDTPVLSAVLDNVCRRNMADVAVWFSRPGDNEHYLGLFLERGFRVDRILTVLDQGASKRTVAVLKRPAA